jgi:glycosyltransferase involved in cell wall biosynthesis
MITFAFASVPKDGGTFTFYRNLRLGPLQHGIDMRCVSIGRAQAELWDQNFADDGCILLAEKTTNIKQQAMEFVAWCEREKIDVVMGINSEAILSSIPHLPERVRVLSRCANGFDHGYKITMSGRERLARIVALTPRLADDLVQHYGADPNQIVLIPNGVDPQLFDHSASAPRGVDPVVRLGFLGRLEHNQKGVFHLPKIVHALNARGVPFKLRIAGKGKHRRIIESQMAQEIKNGQVEFLGSITPARVPQFLAETDLFLFTSHFEGCPNALLEALMAGCVPVSWLIDGITDFIIEDGKTGFICPSGDYNCFADRVQALADDRARLGAMSQRAASSARERFTNQIAASAYARVIKEVIDQPPLKWNPKPWDQFVPDPNFDHSWKENFLDFPFVQTLKNILSH